jgi:hypothetical protein
MRGLAWCMLRCPLDALRSLVLVVFVLACSEFMPQPAAAQAPPSVERAENEHPYCISHLWAVGSQLGWADALARQDAQSEDARMLEYMHAAGQHVQRANELCANSPPPWPAWPNWRDIQSQLTDMADEFQGGKSSRAQLEIALTALHQSLALQLAFRVRGTRVEREGTCAEIYVRLANALGFAQAMTQISQRLTPDAAVRLRQSVSLIYQTGELPEPCRDFKGLIPAIGEALNNPNDSSVVGRVNDIWQAGEVAAGPKVE